MENKNLLRQNNFSLSLDKSKLEESLKKRYELRKSKTVENGSSKKFNELLDIIDSSI